MTPIPPGFLPPSEAMRNAVGPASDLMKVREKIAAGWTQGALARRKSGHEVEPSKPSACRFSLLGAIDAALSRAEGDVLPNRERIAAHLGFGDRFQAAAWNDCYGRTKADVLGIIDAALAREARP